MAQLNHEPSMEDILASIKRIIAEDGEAAAPRAPRPVRREMAPVAAVETPPEDIGEEGPEAFIASEPAPAPAIETVPEVNPADVLELTSPIADDMPPPREPVAIMDRLMSDPAAHASRSAFAALTQLQVRAEAGQENTLEGLVADLLRPMLREWLDRELPALVERLVAAEIGRISGRA
jgi:cell pole-organizing protein PopZ